MPLSKSRLEAISDGIFAFAATLVVVRLDVPEEFADLRANAAQLGSFAISFAALALLWMTHHNYFRRVERMDAWVAGLNFAFLFVVLCYVFPLKFLANLMFRQARIADYAELGELFALYSAGFALVFLCMALLYARAARLNPEQRAEFLYRRNYFLLFVGVGVLSVLLALAGVGARYGVPGYAYWLLGPLCFGYARWWRGVATGADAGAEGERKG